MTEIWLPFPPSVNNLFSQGIVNGKVRRFPSKAYKAWRRDAALRLMAYRLKTVEAPVIVKLLLTPRDSRPRDADNFCKPCLDALVNAGALPDDSNVWVRGVFPQWQEPNSKTCGVTIVLEPVMKAEKPVKLTRHERAMLRKIKAEDYKLVGANYKPTPSIAGLLEKGLIEEIPGLFDGAPQGFTPRA